jgi:hypothetical protein
MIRGQLLWGGPTGLSFGARVENISRNLALSILLLATSSPAFAVSVKLIGIADLTDFNYASATSISGVNYDYSNGVLTQLSSSTSAFWDINPLPNNELFAQVWSGMVNSESTFSVTSFECIEGTFGANVGVHVCGNYSFGDNFINESTVDYSTVPGTRTLGGDDVSNSASPAGFMQQASLFDCESIEWYFDTLQCETHIWDTDRNSRYLLEFQVVPIPPAVWLLGSALGLLGWMRRKAV